MNESVISKTTNDKYGLYQYNDVWLKIDYSKLRITNITNLKNKCINM